MPSVSTRSRRQAALAAAPGSVFVAALTVVTWYAWLGWDHEYQTDPVTGAVSGPYEAWQVIGCALTLFAIGLGAGVRTGPIAPVAAMPLPFTVAWSIDAAGTDSGGLWAVGAVMLLYGLFMGSGVVALLAILLRIGWIGGRLELRPGSEGTPDPADGTHRNRYWTGLRATRRSRRPPRGQVDGRAAPGRAVSDARRPHGP